MEALWAGASVADISPIDSQALFGYPHVERYSTGIHDPLLSSALYLASGQTRLLFIANDIIFVAKESAARVRERISAATEVPAENIMITATHTHSGPSTVDYLSVAEDPTVPPVDPAYLRLFEAGMVQAGTQAVRNGRPAELGLAVADGRGVGTNRRDPVGPADPQVPVLLIRSAADHRPVACMVVYSMHPTVLHEDSRLVSADFPGMARQYLQRTVLGQNVPVLYHTGPAGNQSPRHVVQSNTFAEAERLGVLLGQAIAAVIPGITYTSDVPLQCRRALVDLPRRNFPSVAEAEARERRAAEKLASLRQARAPRAEVRTAEVDWFGTEETLRLARAAQSGALDASHQSCLPAEVQVFRVGPWAFVSWPGEIFIEYSLALKARCPNTFVISLANGEFQGYIATEEAAREGGYEASNAIFQPASGQVLVETAARLLEA